MMAIAAALRQGLICGSDLLQALNPSGPVRSGLGSKMGKSPAKWIKSVVFGRKKSSSRSGSTKAKDLQVGSGCNPL
jgi:hypothetical protein